MRGVLPLVALTLFATPAAVRGATLPLLPPSFGADPAYHMADEPRSWSPDNMYEHVNGEAELLKRYGAAGLTWAAYDNGQGATLTVDILDMGAPINAYGLYRLYAGCDGEEYTASGATVLYGEFTSYALYGRYFLRIDSDTGDEDEDGRAPVRALLAEVSGTLASPEPLPAEIHRLIKVAGKPCEVGYHPEHADYELESGPGYTWPGPDGEPCFIVFLPSPEDARVQASVLRDRGAAAVLVWGNAVAWDGIRTEKTSQYLKRVLRTVVKW